MHEEIISLLNECDPVTGRIVLDYLEKHKLYALGDRVLLYQADFDIIRPLRDVWIKLLDMNSLEFIEFYEGVYSFRKIPHYEDIFTTVLISLSCSLVANMIYDGLLKSKPTLKKELDKFLNNARRSFKYLIKIYAVRKAYYFKKITYKKFIEFRNFLKEKYLKKRKINNKQLTEELNQLWNQFIQEHLLSGQILEEFENFVINQVQLLNSGLHHSYCKEYINLTQEKFKNIRGVSVHSGHALGIVKIISSRNDLHKISEGDIAAFKYFQSECVNILKLCSGVIGFPECGGITGHLAIVCRELKIPCIVQVEHDFDDGQVVYLDSYEGSIRIVSSTSELKKLIKQLWY